MNDSKSKSTLSYVVYETDDDSSGGRWRWLYAVLIGGKWLISAKGYNSHDLAELAMFKLSQKLNMKPKEYKQ